jgi:hypothetical protein
MGRLAVLLVVVSVGVVLSPARAAAQIGVPPFGFSNGMFVPNRVPVIVPSFNPFYYVPQYAYTSGYRLSYGGISLGFTQSYVGVSNPFVTSWALNQLQYTPPYGQGGSYITGGTNVNNDLVLAAQRTLMKAQREASTTGARSEISSQGAYEKGAKVPDPVPAPPAPDLLRSAIVAPEPNQVVSGDALNLILKEILRVETKGVKAPSAFLSPLLLDDLRFAGSPAADLLNLVRHADNLRFPAAFDNPTLVPLLAEVERTFAAVAVSVRDGKSPDSARVAKFEDAFKKLDDASGAVLRDLPFEDAAAARRLLNRMASAIKALKAGEANGLIDPKWATEGLTVGDLVKHMTRHGLVFGPAPRGRDEVYATMHRNLVTYLFVLTQQGKK